jgi:dienelactone hydrolase
MTRRITDQAVVLGERKSLVGIVTQPAGSAPRPDVPAVVILNTGIVHRVGHQRMYVTLARALAAAGHTVLRFDFSGIGDSLSRADGLPPLASCLAEIREVLDWLESARQVRRVVLVGLCSGADHALLYTSADSRVVGMVLIDPSIPPTPRYYLHYFARRLFRWRSWLSVASGRGRLAGILKRRFPRMLALAPGDDRVAVAADNPESRSSLHQAYRGVISAGAEILAVLTAAQDGRQSYREQLLDAFPDIPFGRQLRLEFFGDCDHLFTAEAARTRLVRLIEDWVASAPFRGAAVAAGEVA